MIPQRNGSTVGTVIGVVVFVVAIVGTVFFDWSWNNPEGNLLPLAIGAVAAAVAVVLVGRSALR